MRPYRIFDIGKNADYFDDALNREVAQKVAHKCYLPANALMLELIKKHPGKFKISYSISGVTLDQFAEYTPEVLESFKALAATGQVEFIAETYYHSLAALFNAVEFRTQVEKHVAAIKHHFGVTPTTFRNTELIYSNGIADMVEDMGFKTMLTEGPDHLLDWKSPNFVYEPWNGRGMKLLLKNYKLSDDIAFRFSERNWKDWPLTTEKFARWVHSINGSGDTINLFMDYETFGEHQWIDTGIFDFLRALPEAILCNPEFDFATPSEVAVKYPPVAKLDVPHNISWADLERDVSAWLGNPLQDSTAEWVYRMGDSILASGDEHLIHVWRKLQTSDHFYYMCTKNWADGDVHKFFSCYDSPHEAYVYMNNILKDVELRLKDRPPVISFPSEPESPTKVEVVPAKPARTLRVSAA